MKHRREDYCPTPGPQPRGACFMMLCNPPPTDEQIALLRQHGYGIPASEVVAAGVVRHIRRREQVAAMTDEERTADIQSRYHPCWLRGQTIPLDT